MKAESLTFEFDVWYCCKVKTLSFYWVTRRCHVLNIQGYKEDTMILYFSGTGNSEYIAKRIGRKLNEETVNLFMKIKNSDYSSMYAERPWVIVVPTYALSLIHI